MMGDRLSRDDLLKDSEATLRQVAGILLELWDKEDSGGDEEPRGNGNGRGGRRRLGDLVGVLLQTYREINGLLDGIRKGRGVLQQAAMDRVKRTHQKLEEVSQTTEVAATDMLDGLDRALTLLDQLVPGGGVPAGEEGEGREAAGESLREELHRLISLLQFQDITAQQLAHATGVLAEVEERLESLTKLFDYYNIDAEAELTELDRLTSASSEHPTFDPAASTSDAESRQALADEIFTVVPGGAL